jgi:hypothetical protein
MSIIAGYYITIYYLTLRFNQISLQLKQIQSNNFIHLLKLISVHNILSVYTEKCDILFSLFTCIMHFIVTVAVNLMIYLSIYGNLDIILRLTIINVSIFSSIFLFFWPTLLLSSQLKLIKSTTQLIQFLFVTNFLS